MSTRKQNESRQLAVTVLPGEHPSPAGTPQGRQPKEKGLWVIFGVFKSMIENHPAFVAGAVVTSSIVLASLPAFDFPFPTDYVVFPVDDSLAIGAGLMVGGEKSPEDYLTVSSGKADGCHSGAGCEKIEYQSGAGWAGRISWHAACGDSGKPEVWHTVKQGLCGVDLLQVMGVKQVNTLSFYARGNTGEEVVLFGVGNHEIMPRPGVSRELTLSTEWEKYQIDISNLKMDNAINLFQFTVADSKNENGAVFYLDDIQFEGR